MDGGLYGGTGGHKRFAEESDSAMLVAAAAILGYMVTDSWLAMQAVKAQPPVAHRDRRLVRERQARPHAGDGPLVFVIGQGELIAAFVRAIVRRTPTTWRASPSSATGRS